jgi:hypothetical protein
MTTLDSRRCACGGLITVAVPCLDEDIVRAVRRHQHTVTHLRWLEEGGLDGPRKPRSADPYEGRLAA